MKSPYYIERQKLGPDQNKQTCQDSCENVHYQITLEDTYFYAVEFENSSHPSET